MISGFTGLLPSTPIAYDDFTSSPTRTGFILLSHFHAGTLFHHFLYSVLVILISIIDHYKGLTHNWKGAPIYCSILTRRILLQKWEIEPSRVRIFHSYQDTRILYQL